MDAPLAALVATELPGFATPDLLDRLTSMPAAEADLLGFGVIGFGRDGVVDVYNATEARLSGLSASRIIGRHMFEEVAPCMDNDMVAGRFEAGTALDATLPYVLTLRMRPTPVVLRLLQRPSVARRWVAVNWSSAPA